MLLDRFKKIGCTAIVQKENALSKAPKWRGPALVWTRSALGDTICQVGSHAVNKQIGKEVSLHPVKGGTMLEVPVVIVGVWHKAHPTLIKF